MKKSESCYSRTINFYAQYCNVCYFSHVGAGALNLYIIIYEMTSQFKFSTSDDILLVRWISKESVSVRFCEKAQHGITTSTTAFREKKFFLPVYIAELHNTWRVTLENFRLLLTCLQGRSYRGMSPKIVFDNFLSWWKAEKWGSGASRMRNGIKSAPPHWIPGSAPDYILMYRGIWYLVR